MPRSRVPWRAASPAPPPGRHARQSKSPRSSPARRRLTPPRTGRGRRRRCASGRNGRRARRRSTAEPLSSDCRRSLSIAALRSGRRGRDGWWRGRSQRPARRVRPSTTPPRSVQAPRSSALFRLALSLFCCFPCRGRWPRLTHRLASDGNSRFGRLEWCVVFVVMAHPGHRIREVSFVATLGYEVEQLVSAVHRIQSTAVTRVGVEDRTRVVLVEDADPRCLGHWKFTVLVVVEDRSLNLLGRK